MKILFIWHSAVVKLYRKRLDFLSSFPDIKLLLICPNSSNEGGKTIFFEKGENENYNTLVSKAILKKHHSIQLLTSLKLITEIKKFNPDIVHIFEEPHSLITYQIISYLKIFLKQKPKIIIESFQNIYKKYPFPFNLIEKSNIKNANAFIAHSKEIKTVLLKKNACNKILITTLGLDLADYENKFSRKNRNNFIVGFIGRIEKHKGIYDLIEAIKILKNKLNVHLSIIGTGSETKKLQEYIQKNQLEKFVALLGFIKQETISEYMTQFDVLVVPSKTTSSWKEQFGRVIIEAMASKVPVIGSNSGEIPNVIENAGIIFEEGNITQLAKEIANLLQDSNLRLELIHRGYEKIITTYTWQSITKKLYSFYQEIN